MKLEKEILKIYEKYHTLVGLDMKTGEYSVLPELLALFAKFGEEIIGSEVVPFFELSSESRQIEYFKELGSHNLQIN